MIDRNLVCGGLLALLGCTASYATIVTTPAGLAPGTQYQLVFVTSDQFFANATSISTYNTDVTNEAALNSTLAAFDTANSVTWTVIGSTTSVNANVNAPSTGLVYTLNGVKVAQSGSSLYSGGLLNPIDIDENGNTATTTVWTGSNSAGTASGGINDLGQTFTEYGLTSSTTGAWIADTNGVESDNDMPLYALSSVITVPGTTSSSPEPGTFILLPGAALLFFRLRRRSKHRAPQAS